MSNESLQRFKESMKLDYMKWHEGEGYDLSALGELEGADREEVEQLLISRAREDWRDLEALDMLGTEGALAAIEGALESSRAEVRVDAMQRLVVRKLVSEERLEDFARRELSRTSLLKGQTKLLTLCASCPTLTIKRLLLKTSLEGGEDTRVHAAALAHFLYGKSRRAFDFDHRPFYLRFSEERPRGPFRELCEEVGESPEVVLTDSVERDR